MRPVAHLTCAYGNTTHSYVDPLRTTEYDELYIKTTFGEITRRLNGRGKFDFLLEKKDYMLFARLVINDKARTMELKSQSKDLESLLKDIHKKAREALEESVIPLHPMPETPKDV